MRDFRRVTLVLLTLKLLLPHPTTPLGQSRAPVSTGSPSLVQPASRVEGGSASAHSAQQALRVYTVRVVTASPASVKCNIISMLTDARDPSCQPKCFFPDDVTYFFEAREGKKSLIFANVVDANSPQ